MKKLVIVGCGRLAEIVADAVVKGLLPDYNLVGVYSRTASKAAHIVNKMQQHGKPCIACATLEELLALKPDYLVLRTISHLTFQHHQSSLKHWNIRPEPVRKMFRRSPR